MSSPRLVGDPVEAAGNTDVHIAWDAGTGRGAGLPATYFEDVTFPNDFVVLATKPAGEREMIVTLGGAPSTHAGKTATFTLLFPDRSEHIACGHAGMTDVYKLIVTLKFSADGATATATFEQHVDLGAI